MIVTKYANTKENIMRFTVELERPEDYDGHDVYPDDRLGDLLIALGSEIKTKFKKTKMRAGGHK